MFDAIEWPWALPRWAVIKDARRRQRRRRRRMLAAAVALLLAAAIGWLIAGNPQVASRGNVASGGGCDRRPASFRRLP